MAHETPTLSAQKRDRIGTRYARRLRAAGRLPAVIYGHRKDPVHVSVDARDALHHLHHGVHLFNIDLEGEAETCLVKDLQFGYLGDDVVHLDFARVDLNEEVTVNVALHLHGEPAAARKPGAVLTHQITDLEVICRAGDIPSEIEADISQMKDVFTVGDLKLPEGVRTELDPDTPIVTITFVSEVEEAEEMEVVGEAEPEVITEAKDKKEEED